MNKKIFGIKIGTILQLVLCLILAAIIWFVVQYANLRNSGVEEEASMLFKTLSCALRL